MANVTADDVFTALELIAGRVPDRHVTPDLPMAAIWYQDLSRFDRAAVFAAARSWNGLRFPSAGEFFTDVQVAAQNLAAAEQRAHASGELDVHACPHACESGWIEADAAGHGTVQPCPRHRPVEYATWAHRRTPGHQEDHCSDCIAIRTKGVQDPSWLTDARQIAAGRVAADF